MISFDEFGEMLDEIANELPPELYVKLNGGVNLIPDLKIHPESKSNDLFILGQYFNSSSLGRYINIYYESFVNAHGHLSNERLRKRLTSVLKHEFLHHLESLAGENELEIKDAEFLARYKGLL